MALWGNNDNVSVQSGGTVSVNYDTGVVTGTGTTFGTSGFAQPGDVIRFGVRGRVGAGATYYGDAVIVSVASTVSLTIGSTDGLQGGAIGNTSFTITQCPQYTVTNPSFSEDPTFNAEAPSFKTIAVGGAHTNVLTSIGASIIPVNLTEQDHGKFLLQELKVGDIIVNDGNNIPIVSISTAAVAVNGFSPVGFATLFIQEAVIPGVFAGDAFGASGVDVDFGGSNQQNFEIVSVASTAITLGSTISSGISTGTRVLFDGAFMIGLGATITAGIATGDKIEFKRLQAGYDRFCYGIGSTNASVAEGSQYQVDHAGWVGVTTYIDNHGNLRVKKETLVAMSGIATGNAPVYDADPMAGN